MVDHAAVPPEVVVDRLRAVAVRVEQEAAVVVGAVLGTQARLAVVAIAGVDSRLPERVDVSRVSAVKPMWRPRVTGLSSFAGESQNGS